MPTYTFNFYNGSPFANGFGFDNPGSTFTYTGPAKADGTLVVTDNANGPAGEDLTSNETATADATINGTTSIGSAIDAAAGFLIEDTVTGESFAVIWLIVEDGPAAGQYTLSEMRFVTGRSYELQGWTTDPKAGSPGAFTYSDYVCFAAGTLIETTQGPQPVEKLRAGARVVTLDHGPQTVIWVGSRRLILDATNENQKPILIKRNALGPGCPQQDLAVSPQHKVFFQGLSSGPTAPRDGFFAPAHFLLETEAARVMRGKRSVTYQTFMTARHEIIYANGLGVETFYPGPYGLGLLSPEEYLGVYLALFRTGKFGPRTYGKNARPTLTRCDFRKLKRVKGISLCSFEPAWALPVL